MSFINLDFKHRHKAESNQHESTKTMLYSSTILSSSVVKENYVSFLWQSIVFFCHLDILRGIFRSRYLISLTGKQYNMLISKS